MLWDMEGGQVALYLRLMRQEIPLLLSGDPFPVIGQANKKMPNMFFENKLLL